MAQKTRLTLKDVLSHLSYAQARKMLGPRGQALLRRGGASSIDIDTQVRMDSHCFSLDLGRNVVTLRLSDAAAGRIDFSCTGCADTLRACWGRALPDPRGEAGTGACRGPVRCHSPGNALRRRADRTRACGQGRAGPYGTDDAGTPGREGDLARLRRDEQPFGQDLPGRAPRLGSGRIVLFLSRFQDKHAGDLQAPALCRQSHEEKAAGERCLVPTSVLASLSTSATAMRRS